MTLINKDLTTRLNEDTLLKIKSYLSVDELAQLTLSTKAHCIFFNPPLKLQLALKAVVEGNPTLLSKLIIKDPDLLFKKDDVIDLSGQRFYNVSPFQLMIFLADARMLRDIIKLMPNNTNPKLLEQMTKINSGGADLVKVNFEPTQELFSKLLHHKISFPEIDDKSRVTIPGARNEDALIYYFNKTENTKHIYYADLVNQKITEVDTINSVKKSLNKLYSSFENMPDNSSDRSSNEIYRLIAETLFHPITKKPILLKRQGIEYETVDGVRYCDNRFNFNRHYNTHRKCIQLYQDNQFDEADNAWLELGQRQRECMWTLQFIGQQNLTYSPVPDFDNVSNKRQLMIKNVSSSTNIKDIIQKLGSEGTILKGGADTGSIKDSIPASVGNYLPLDLIASSQLIEGEMMAVNRLLQGIIHPRVDAETQYLPHPTS